MTGEIVAFVVFGGAAGAVVAYLSKLSKRDATKRREAFAAFARSQDWAYLGADHSLAGRWRGVPFGIGHHRDAINAVAGKSQGREFTAFDYSYQVPASDGRTTTTYGNGIVAMTMPGALPYLQVEPAEVIGGEFAIALGFRENEDFNRAFRVNAVDDGFRHGVLDPQVMESLVAAEHRFSWRFEGNTLVCWTPGPQQADLILAKLDHLRMVLDLVPPHIWKDYAGVEVRDSPAD